MSVFATVSNPQTEGTQTKYLITTHRCDTDASPPAEPEQSEVYHRYSEFQWLYERLIRERRGAVIPIAGLRFGIAAKAGMGAIGTSSEDDTVAGRCRRLDAFMKTVSSNPELRGAPSLEVFLANETGEKFDTAKAKLEAAADPENASSDDEAEKISKAGDANVAASTSPPPKAQAKTKRTGFRQYVAKTAAKTATALAARQGKTKLHETEDEELIKIADQYVKDLEVQMKSMADQASALNRSGRDSAAAWANFGKASGLWSEVLQSRHTLEGIGGPKLMSEQSVKVVLTDKDEITAEPSREGTCARLETVNTLSTKAADKLTKMMEREKDFSENMQDLLALLTAMKVALHKRSNCQLMCTSRLQQASKVSSQSSADAKDIEKANMDANEAKEELEQATKRFLREMERVDVDLDRRLCRTVEAYAQVQLEKAVVMQKIWSDMVNIGASVAKASEEDKDRQTDQETKGGLPPMPSGPPPPEPSAPPLE